MFVKIGDFLLNLKVLLWTSYRTGAPQKIKNPQEIAKKIYNAPSLHTLNFRYHTVVCVKFRFEKRAACYRIENRENPENSRGGCWEECRENSGCCRECWRGCCEGGFPWKGKKEASIVSEKARTESQKAPIARRKLFRNLPRTPTPTYKLQENLHKNWSKLFQKKGNLTLLGQIFVYIVALYVWVGAMSAINQAIHLPTLTLTENILGNFWLAECLQHLGMQNYRHPVYRPKVVLGIVEVMLYRL